MRVAIVGNGPVGQSAALLLARWGVPTVLLDRRPRRDPVGSKAICQHRDVLDIWEAVGAGGQVAAEGVTWTTARTYYRVKELFAITLRDPGRSPFPPFVNISQSRTEEVLDERIAAQPLIDVRWGYEVAGIGQDATGVTLRCVTAAGAETVTADYAVLCAGASCHDLRETVGVRFDGHSFADKFLICDIRAELPGWESERRFYFDPEWNPGRQVLIHPCPGGTYRIDWQVPPNFDLEAEERGGGLDRRIRQIIGDRPYEVVWRSVYRFHARCADRMRVGRVLLAGDAAHLMAPFGARGLNSGVQDAENAAWKLAFVLRGWAPETLLDTYHDERLAAAKENLDVTSATMRFLVPHSDAEWAYRLSVLEQALHDPAARGRVDSGRLAEPFWYVDSPLTTRNPTRAFRTRPPRGELPPPVPGVLVPDVPVRMPGSERVSRLREIVRDGFLVLLAPGADAAVDGVTQAPVRILRMTEIDPGGALVDTLRARTGEAWLVRPDGHVAAVVPVSEPGALTAALARALCLPP
ncbi:MAG: FAD-dependent monooxygenase [Micromonosporaceae bacterium]